MCLAIPGKVESISGNDQLSRVGKVNFGGVLKEVSLAYVPEVKVGDYVIVHVGFALSRLDEAEAHKIFDYFLDRFEFVIAGTIEPLPGIPPTTKHIAEVEKLIQREGIKFILQDVYNPQDASSYLSKKLNVKLIIMPHDVGSIKEADNVFRMFDEIVRRLTNG